MSSNYRILLYFLSTLNESLQTGLGVRHTPNFYRRLNRAALSRSNAQLIEKNNSSTTKSVSGSESSGRNVGPSKNKNKNNLFTPDKVVEDIGLIMEGLKQYANYAKQHNTTARSPLRENALPFLNDLVKRNPFPPSVSSREFPFQTEQKPLSSIHVNSSPSKEATDEHIGIQKETPTNHVPIRKLIRHHEEETHSSKSSITQTEQASLSGNSKARKVPSNRTSRVFSFGGLALNLGIGALGELTKRALGASNVTNQNSKLGSSILLSEANALKIVDTLCRVRGAALKLGQMLSIQDSEIVGPEIQAIFERVRQSADYMPSTQMHQVMSEELGNEWKSLFADFDEKPFAAASIGQVHRARLPNGTAIAVKVQYPGVAESIESDIKNVLTILKYANIFPEGLFIDHIMAYAKKELGWEVDYVREAECAETYRSLVQQHCDPNDRFHVPLVYRDLSTKRVLTCELIKGISIDKLDDYRETSSQVVKNSLMQRLLKLFFQELFVFNYMQTDPNWSNFFYDFETDTITLIDFGSSRPYPKEFVQKYFAIVRAAIDNDRELVLQKSLDIGFLSGYESEVFKTAHVDSVMIIGEAIREPNLFDFGKQAITKQIHDLVPVMLRHRLKPPPEEIYSLHRKLSGLFLLFAKLKVEINCRKAFEEATVGYR